MCIFLASSYSASKAVFPLIHGLTLLTHLNQTHFTRICLIPMVALVGIVVGNLNVINFLMCFYF